MDFIKKLEKKWNEEKFVCIGLDPVSEKIPKSVSKKNQFFEFNKAIIDETHDLVCCYKPNSAFYEALGADGVGQLKKTFEYINKKYPDVSTILDAKRADIGNTNEGYVKFIFKYLEADAVTIHPYLGKEAVGPFLERQDKGIIILCKTSNEGAGEFQDFHELYKKVALNVVENWNKNGNCCVVVGATYPEELKVVREIIREMPILIPGIGAQGGDLEATIRNGINSKKQGIIISSSRGIIFASGGSDFAKAARAETEKFNTQISEVLNII